MAHADVIAGNLFTYQRMTENSEKWKTHLDYLFGEKHPLYGRLRLATNLIFRIGLEYNKNGGYVDVFIWRETPDPMEMRGDSIKLKLAHALNNFPEIQTIEYHKSWEELEKVEGLE